MAAKDNDQSLLIKAVGEAVDDGAMTSYGAKEILWAAAPLLATEIDRLTRLLHESYDREALRAAGGQEKPPRSLRGHRPPSYGAYCWCGQYHGPSMSDGAVPVGGQAAPCDAQIEAWELLRDVIKPCKPQEGKYRSWYACGGDDDPTVGYGCSDGQCENPDHQGRRPCGNRWHSLSPGLRSALAAAVSGEQR